MLIRRLVAADAQVYWQTRNRGLAEFPDAFTTTHAEGVATPPEKLALRVGDAGDSGSDHFVLGAFDEDGTLAAQVGFEREARSKSRHKGTLIGMYVVPEFRGRGLGKQLVAALIAEARARAGMEQINLTVTHRNAEARALYLKAGFVSFGVEKNALKVDGRYYDKEYMTLTL